MPSERESDAALARASPVFATTHWSVVLAAGQSASKAAENALEELCRRYWYPLYAYLRRKGYSEHDAQDLTQGFFEHLIERRTLESVGREKGKFRSFLLSCLNHFLAHERERAGAQKRGGGRELISLNGEEAEQRYRLEPRDERSPERIFEHRWAMTLLDQVLAQLDREFQETGRENLFQKVRPFLVEGKGNGPYRHAADEIGMSEEAFKKAVQRMRRRYSELFRSEIAHTVATKEEVDEELRYLCGVLAS